MTYSDVVAADSPVLWYRMVEGGGYSRNVGSDAANLYSYTTPPTVGFTGIASDGGAVCLYAGATMAAYAVTTITALSGYSLEGWIFVQGETPFNPATLDFPLQLFIAADNGLQVGMTASSRLAAARDPSHTSQTAGASTAASYGWHHLCATRESGASTPLHLYVDGTLVGSSTSYTNFGVTDPVRFNLITTPTAVSLFVAEPAVYYTELSSSRVAAHAAAYDTLASPKFVTRMPGVCS